eukprot:502404-Pyramimonas_sp.AAC.1
MEEHDARTLLFLNWVNGPKAPRHWRTDTAFFPIICLSEAVSHRWRHLRAGRLPRPAVGKQLDKIRGYFLGGNKEERNDVVQAIQQTAIGSPRPPWRRATKHHASGTRCD